MRFGKAAFVVVALAAMSLAMAGELNSGPADGTFLDDLELLNITGPYQRGPICYHCRFADDAVVAAFVKVDSVSADELVRAIQKLVISGERGRLPLKAYIVMLGSPTDSQADLEIRLVRLATEYHISLPLAIPRNGLLPPVLHINPNADNTLILYRERRVVQSFVNADPNTLRLSYVPQRH